MYSVVLIYIRARGPSKTVEIRREASVVIIIIARSSSRFNLFFTFARLPVGDNGPGSRFIHFYYRCYIITCIYIFIYIVGIFLNFFCLFFAFTRGR